MKLLNIKAAITNRIVFLLCSIAIVCLLLAWGCSTVQEELSNFQKNQAVKELKKGEINDNIYINKYYKCQLSIGTDFDPYLSYPKSLIVLTYIDKISEINLFAKGSLKRNTKDAIQVVSNVDTYNILEENRISFKGLRSKEIIYTYKQKNESVTTLLYLFSYQDIDYFISFTTLTPLFNGLQGKMKKAINTFSIFGYVEADKPSVDKKQAVTIKKIPPVENKKTVSVQKEVKKKDPVPIQKNPVKKVKSPPPVQQTEFKLLKHDINSIWQAVIETITSENYSIRFKNDEKYFLMTGYKINGNSRYRYTIKIDSTAPAINKLKVLCSMQNRTDNSSWDNASEVKGEKVWALENNLYNQIGTFLQ